MKYLLLIFVLLFSSATTMATDNNRVKETRLVKKTSTNKPQKPSNQFIECIITGDVISVSLPAGTDHAELELSEEGSIVWCGTVSAANPTVQCPAIMEEVAYILICTLPDGSEYCSEIVM